MATPNFTDSDFSLKKSGKPNLVLFYVPKLFAAPPKSDFSSKLLFKYLFEVQSDKIIRYFPKVWSTKWIEISVTFVLSSFLSH